MVVKLCTSNTKSLKKQYQQVINRSNYRGGILYKIDQSTNLKNKQLYTYWHKCKY